MQSTTPQGCDLKVSEIPVGHPQRGRQVPVNFAAYDK